MSPNSKGRFHRSELQSNANYRPAHRSYDQKLGEVVIWDLLNEQRLLTIHTDDPQLRCAAFSPDGELLAAAGESLHYWIGTDLAIRRARLKKAISRQALLDRLAKSGNAAAH